MVSMVQVSIYSLNSLYNLSAIKSVGAMIVIFLLLFCADCKNLAIESFILYSYLSVILYQL